MFAKVLRDRSPMILVTLLVFVSVVGGSVNSTEVIEDGGKSRMVWLRELFDHHQWFRYVTNDTALPPHCAEDLRSYLTALNNGQIWASKIYDASGQYSSNVLFGSDYWLGSLNACLDLQLKQYYAETPIFDTTFFVARINLTVDRDHLPQSRVMLVGECIPSSCGSAGLLQLLQKAESAAAARAADSGITASIQTLGVRKVPGDYDLFTDTKFLILGPAMVLVAALMLAASLYEGYLERKHRLAGQSRSDPEAHDDHIKSKDFEYAKNEVKSFKNEKKSPNASCTEKLLEKTEFSARNAKTEHNMKIAFVRLKNDSATIKYLLCPGLPTISCDAKNHNNNVPNNDAKKLPRDQRDKDIRRETCGMWSEMLLSFSILSNGRTILSTDKPSDGALTCLHGMRFMSVVWVIMVHTYLTVFYVADNKTMRVVTERNFMYQSVGNASYCVDTFFFISGLLVTVLFLRTEEKKAANRKDKKQIDKQDVNKNINGYTNSALSVSVISQQSFCEDLIETPKSKAYTKQEILSMTKSFFVLFTYRVVRLTPAYAFVIGVNEIALRYTHYTSVFESAVIDHITCDHFWWRNLLYINNLFTQREMCMVWSWYMANDTQFYVVGIILLLISVKYPKVSWGLLGLVLASSWATTIYISVSLQYKARIQEPFEMFDPLYDKPWSRIGPYLVGMMVGWYLQKTRCQVRIPYWVSFMGWPCAAAIMGSLIFGMVDGYFEVWPTAFYVSIGHTAWSVGLAWVSIACCCGYGGLVNSALSYRGLLPLSRLTYCAYLIHPTIMMYTSALMDGPLHMQNSMVLTIYAGYAVMAFLASFAISLAFEAPAVRLLKIISGGSKPNKTIK